MLDLKRQFGRTYRIALDESAEIDGQTREERLWLYQIPCKHGHIYVHGKDRLGVYCSKPNVIPVVLAIPGVVLHQRGDREASATFDPAILAQVAQVMRAKKRRVPSEAQLEHLAKITAERCRDKPAEGESSL